MAAQRAYLVRHGAAEEHGAHGDASRRLTPSGAAGFRALAASLRPRLAVSRILTSPFTRARQTADLLGRATGAEVEEDPALASGRSDGSSLLDLARRAGPGAAVVGHNPEIAGAIALAGGHGQHVPPGTVAAIDFTDSGASLAWLASPADTPG